MRFLLILSLLFSFSMRLHASSSQAMGYLPAYEEGFKHFNYVNPEAPKGGMLTLSALGSFDSLNPYILKGTSASGLGNLMFETLMTGSLDEPFSQYGLLADDVELAEDRLSVIFHLNPKAKFNDGSQVMPEDVIFSFDTLTSQKAHPQYRFYWSDVKGAEIVGEGRVRFNFNKVNPELHLIIGQMPIFSRHWVGEDSFDQLALKKPVTSGPYRIESYNLGKDITYERNPDYWAKDLNSRKGMFNFDRITYKYYRDATVALEAFKAGEFEFNHEYNSKNWANDYVGPRFNSAEIKKEQLQHRNNAGMQGFIFNLRKPIFQDQKVRQAISLALDFEWSNSKLFYNQYERCYSYFSNSELAATGTPSVEELKLLEPFRSELPELLFNREWLPASTKPPMSLRQNLRKARGLLQQAGLTFKGGMLIQPNGDPFSFEVILAQKGFERILAPFARNLKKLGIEVEYRTVDRALYQRRMDQFEFDMVVASYSQSQSPGNELMGMFHSSAADLEGSRNLFGINNPVVDSLVEQIVYAKSRQELKIAAKALDRVLLYNDYLVPHWFIGSHRIAWWDRFGTPKTLPLYYSPEEWMLMTWWRR